MKWGESWGMRAACFLGGGTGIAYGYLKYFRQVHGEFGLEQHPWQGTLQHLHVLAGPLVVFALGVAIRGHASGMLRQRGRAGWWSGLTLALLSVPLVFGGYGIQVVVGEVSRTVLAWVHGVAGLLFVTGYLWHVFAFRRQGQAAARRNTPAPSGLPALLGRGGKPEASL